MSEAVHNSQEEFWRPPTLLEPVAEDPGPVMPALAETCPDCHSEFLIGARFCHACGAQRPENIVAAQEGSRLKAQQYFANKLAWLQSVADDISSRDYPLPAWLRYLHFHEIKRWIGLPTPSLIAFIVGIGCVIGAVSVGLFYKASNMDEFQAIQMWRIEWLLAATASFVAGILLKRSSDR
ncbi:MAG TPA: zinc ribbon domain-containing protein [Candidatus Sulfotelmatobacter sp.]|nr:zinc ribbon domain-containing protein [Candidatus Sulfotelmatobacter sp.]